MTSKINPTSRSSRIRVGITIGDPAGIGPVITEKAINRLKDLADFVIIGSLDKTDRRKFPAGIVSCAAGRASLQYLDNAIDLIKNKKIDCLVTCPVSKEAINLAGFRFQGHTEYLARAFGAKNYVMMLLNQELKFSLITRHIPLNKVSGALNSKMILDNVRVTLSGLRRLFAIKKPRLVFCGLNPHASDNGVIGREESVLIRPAIKKIERELRISIDGPLSADVAVSKAYAKEYDCVMAMYHDQALIPLKLTGKYSGVNLTLGLPFVRTSPLHGTAFDIASRPERASPDSLIEAIKLAIKCASNLKKD
ncbi:MAG: 4-hydroxythreonine-4-phosphate dehydrogenase PdxA [Candidatus Omnitrophica bacterium]|nr:4-hydroxythreonine-4-phosphate dehydrogenase PdxA [Candidatus Omnitrophota bacterium]